MSEISEYELGERDRKRFENARLAMTRGNSEYTVEICSDILAGSPGCIDARKLLRKAQRQVFAAKGQSLGVKAGNAVNYAILPLGYLNLSRNPSKSMAIGEVVLSRDAYNARALSLVARGANKLGFNETEAFCLESICDRYPNNAVTLERLCEALIKVGSTEKALSIAERLTRLRPGSGHVQELVKSASVAHSINQGKWAEKEEDFRSKLKDKEESDSLERANRVALDEHASEDRIRDLIATVHQDPQQIDNYKLLVRAYLSLENYDDALSWLEKAFELPQAEGDVSLLQLRSELKVSRVEREVFDLKRSADDSDPSGERLTKLEKELLELKLEESRKLVEQFPNDYVRRYKYGEYLLEAGSIDTATQQFQISQRSPSLRLKSLVLLGRCFMAKQLFDLALEQLKTASESLNSMDDFKKEVLYLLAECLDHLGRDGEAIDVFKSIYASDIAYRDVANKIDAFYGKSDG